MAADGAGTASRSEVGSACAVDAAVAVLSGRDSDWPDSEQEWQELLTDALRAAQGAVEEAADEREMSPREFASTLIVVVVTPTAVATGHVGDGTAVVLRDDEELSTLSEPHKGRYANETIFIVSPDALEKAQFDVWKGSACAIAMCTDGLENMMLNIKDGKPRAEFLHPLFRYVARIDDLVEGRQNLGFFLQSPKIVDRTRDDVTLVIATTQTLDP